MVRSFGGFMKCAVVEPNLIFDKSFIELLSADGLLAIHARRYSLMLI